MTPSLTKSCALLIACACFLMACNTSAPDTFQVEPGFTVTRVAAEPLILDPVDLEFNEWGDAMVLEMPGYPFEDKQSRIVVLKDRNTDGIYDDKIVFVENLQLANSFMPYKKGVLVAAPPYLLFVRDDDQNYVPDRVDTLMGGFSTGNLQHNYNALTFGLDTWIYAANGGNDGAPYWWNDTTTRLDLRGQDFRFNLETKTLERLGESSGGFGLALDEFGRVFETHNLTHISHLVFPDRYVQGKQLLQPHSLTNISDHDENGLARIYPIGEQESRVNHPEQSGYFSGSCGITHYGGGAFGAAYDNTVWVADVVLNLIHVDKINPRGASFVASRLTEKRDFLASSDRAFRPVNMTVGPDGALYVVDMYRKVIEHPEWIPDDIEKTLDLEAGKDQGRIYRITKSDVDTRVDLAPFKFNTQEELIKYLTHPNQWVRNTAHRLLKESPMDEKTEGQVKKLLTSEHVLGRLHALWLLGTNREGRHLAPDDLYTLLNDPHPAIREAALVVSESFIPSDGLAAKVLARTADEHERVKMQALLTASLLDRHEEAFNDYRQPFLDALEAASTSQDPWIVSALTLAAGDDAPDLLARLLTNPHPAPTQAVLNSLALASGQTANGLSKVLRTLQGDYVDGARKVTIIHHLTQGLTHTENKSAESGIKLLERSGEPGLIAALANLRRKLNLPPAPEFLAFSRTALNKVLDTTLTDSMRVQQLALIELLPYRDKASVLFQCLANSQPLKLQENALRQLAAYNEVSIGQKVVSLWNELSPQTRRYASDLLLYIETHHDALLTGLENGTINIGEMNFDLERRRQLLWWTDNDNTRRRAEKLFSDAGVANRQHAIDKMKPALTLAGSAEKGVTVFESVCGNCHQYGHRGVAVGPALTEIGRKSKETLLHDILDPNAAADPNYINHRLELNNGQVHLGIVASETDQAIVLRKIGGESVTLRKADVKSFRSLGTSLMMEGLESALTLQEMADLLAFLQNGAR